MDDVGAIGRIALLVAAGWVAIVWACAALYVVVTYMESLRRLPRRPWIAAVFWALRELVLAMWTQPLMPIFQLLGERMGSGGGDVPVVLVHGYFQNRVDFLYLASRLRRARSGPLFAFNFFWPQHLETSSAQLRRFVERVQRQTGAPQVDLLTHSTGGLFALDLMAENPSAVRRVAVVAIPAHGVAWRGPVLGWSGSQLRSSSSYQSFRSGRVGETPVLSVFSAHDNVVHPTSTSTLEGPMVRNMEIDGPGHLSVLFDSRSADAICEFLVPPATKDDMR